MPIVGEGIYEFLGNDARLKQALATNQANIQRAGAVAEQSFSGRLDAGIARTAGRFDQLTSKSKAFGSILQGLGLGAGVVGFQLLSSAVADVTGFFTDSISAASKAQAQIQNVTNAVKINDKAWDGNADSIERAIKAGEELGFTHEEQAKSLGLLVAQTHSLNDALEVQRVAMDVSRLTGKDLGAVTLQLGKAYDGITTGLRRWGIVLPQGVKGMEAIAAAEKIAAGSATAFANTTAGAQAVLGAKFEALQIQVGNLLLPVLAKLAAFASDTLLPAIEGVGGAIGGIVNFTSQLPGVSIIFDHLGASVEALALILTAKLVIGAGRAAASLLGLGEATVALEGPTAAHIASADAAVVATEAEAAAADDNAQAILAEAAAEGTTAIATEGAVLASVEHAGALKAETVAAENTGRALSGLRFGLIGLLIGLPILSAVSDKLNEVRNQTVYASKFGADYDKVLKAVGNDAGKAGYAFAFLTKIAEKLGVGVGFATDQFLALVAGGLSVEDALSQMADTAGKVNPQVVKLNDAAGTASQTFYDTSAATNAAADSFNDLGLRAAVAAQNVAVAAGDIVPAFAALRDEIVTELGGIDDGLVATVKDATGKVVPLIDDLGSDVGIHLKDGSYLVTSAASVMANGIPAAVDAAGKAAAVRAEKIPGELADAILKGESDLSSAADRLAAVATRKLVDKAAITETRKQMADLLKTVKDGGHAMTAEQQATYDKLQIELAGYLLEIDPTSKEAAGILHKYLTSEDKPTADAAAAMLKAVETNYANELPIIQQMSDELGISLADAFKLHQAEAAEASKQQTEAVLRNLQGLKDPAFQAGSTGIARFADGVDSGGVATGHAATGIVDKMRTKLNIPDTARGWGYNVGTGYAGGLTAATSVYTTAVQNFVDSGSRILKGAQSPDYHLPRVWGEGVATAYANALTSGVGKLESGLRARQAVIGGLLQPTLAAAAGGPAAGGALQRPQTAAEAPPTPEEHLHLHVDGKSPLIETWQDVLGAWDRMSYINDRRLVSR